MTPRPATKKLTTTTDGHESSKDAYMLVYKKRTNPNIALNNVQPPETVMKEVIEDNKKIEQDIKEWEDKWVFAPSRFIMSKYSWMFEKRWMIVLISFLGVNLLVWNLRLWEVLKNLLFLLYQVSVQIFISMRVFMMELIPTGWENHSSWWAEKMAWRGYGCPLSTHILLLPFLRPLHR